MTVRGNWDSLIGDWEGFVARDDVPPWEHGQWVRDELTDDDAALARGRCPTSHDLV